jgi:hypothetical protein
MIGHILGPQAPPHLLSKARPRLEGGEHPDALQKICLTRAREFSKLATYKSPGRLYRPRVALTIEQNGGFDPNSSESVIYLDCYLLPERVKIDKETGLEKDQGEPPGPVSVGEQITLTVIKNRAKDKTTVKEFDIIVTDVHWGGFLRTLEDGDTEERVQLSLGLIEGQVQGRYERSLLMDSEYDIRANKYSIAA